MATPIVKLGNSSNPACVTLPRETMRSIYQGANVCLIVPLILMERRINKPDGPIFSNKKAQMKVSSISVEFKKKFMVEFGSRRYVTQSYDIFELNNMIENLIVM